MDEIYSDAEKITPKPFFVSALIAESITAIVLIAVLLSLRFISPKLFKSVKNFYVENVCYNAINDEEKS